MANKPTAPFVLIVIGALFVLLSSIIVGALGTSANGIIASALNYSQTGHTYNTTSNVVLNGRTFTNQSIAQITQVGSLVAFLLTAGAVIGFISGIALIICALRINYGDPSKVRYWSVIAIIFTFISLASFGGFVIGFLLALIGSILGITYKPDLRKKRN